MIRRAIHVLGLAGILILSASTASYAQSGFNEGYVDLGPVVGLGGIGGASISIGGRFEYGFKSLPDLGNGVLSFAAGVDHYAYDCGFASSCSFSFTPISATVNYHLHLDNRQIDPFIGLGLGDYLSSCSVSGISCTGFNSGIYFVGRVGLRYFITNALALYGDLGSGSGALHVGVMWKIMGGK